MEHKIENDSVGKKMEYCRKCAKLSRERLSEMLGIEKSVLEDCEEGRALPRIKCLLDFYRIFNLEFDSLIDNEFTLADFEKQYTPEHCANYTFPLKYLDSAKQTEDEI